jgi:outer membrane murein-binding lipoprotein Lpp
VNIWDSTRTKSRMLGVLGQVAGEKTYRSLRSSGQLPPLYVLRWALIVTILLFMVSGCGRYKEELESAKQQIEKLNSEVKRLTGEVARLNQEKDRLSSESKAISDKNAQMQRELDALNKTKAALSNENKEMRKKDSSANEQMASLKREKDRLAQEVERLKKRPAEMAPPKPSPATVSPRVGAQSTKRLEELSPCDAVIGFMRASEGIVRQHKGAERTKLLEQVHQQYAQRMKGAPEKAIKAAETWVKEGTKFWDKSSDYPTYRLLQLRNTVLEACGKSPKEAGF